MLAQLQYGGVGSLYTFEVPGGTQVGDHFEDGGQTLVVRALGSDYTGAVRSLEQRNRRPAADVAIANGDGSYTLVDFKTAADR